MSGVSTSIAGFVQSCWSMLHGNHGCVSWSEDGTIAIVLMDRCGRVALLTGCRVKIGFEIGIKLLRAGATLVATTRFPADAAARYAAQPDFDTWKHRLGQRRLLVIELLLQRRNTKVVTGLTRRELGSEVSVVIAK